MSAITLAVNGRSHVLDVDPTTPLLYILADDLALRGPKFGCGLGQCGACTVIAGGRAIRSCVTPVNAAPDAEMQQAMSPVLCRCFTHTRMLRAIQRYAREL